MRLIDADALIEFCAKQWIPLNIDAVNMQPTIQPVAPDTNVGDIISRKAAIDRLNHKLAEPQYQHNGEDWYVGMNCAESEMWELPSVQIEPKWIPVSELLPEEDGFYLVTVNYGGAAWVHESYFMQCNSRGVHWDYPDVTAWMPMPEHYKGE